MEFIHFEEAFATKRTKQKQKKKKLEKEKQNNFGKCNIQNLHFLIKILRKTLHHIVISSLSSLHFHKEDEQREYFSVPKKREEEEEEEEKKKLVCIQNAKFASLCYTRTRINV